MKAKINLSIYFFFLLLLAGTEVHAQSKPIPRDTSYTPYSAWVKIKKQYPNVTLVKPQLPEGVIAEQNIVYATLPYTPYGKRDLHLDLFRLEKPGKYPALVLVFGGGWRSGSKEAQVPMAQQIAAKGYVTAAIEYRLSPEALYPADVYDIKAAIRYLRANAAKYDIDPDKIAITGSSAGGQLAALVGMTSGIEKFDVDECSLLQAQGTAQTPNENTSTKVQAIIDIDGILDFRAPEESASDNILGKRSAGAYWFGKTFKEDSALWIEASPIEYAGENTPPILFINSAQPRFHAGRDSVISILKPFHIYTEVHTIPNSVHSFWQVYPWFDETVGYMISFLDKVLK